MQRMSISEHKVTLRPGSSIGATPEPRVLMMISADCMLLLAGHLYALGTGSVIAMPPGTKGNLLYGRHCHYMSLHLHQLMRDPLDLEDQIRRLYAGLTHLRPSSIRFAGLKADLARIQELIAAGEGQGKAAYARLYDLVVRLVTLGKSTVVEALTANRASAKLVSDVRAYLNLVYLEPVSVSALAARFYVSASHLCRAFKKEMGCSIVTYVNDLRIARAASVLQAGKRCAQARDESGYGSSQHFIKQFRIRYGTTPGQYRKRFTRPKD